MPKPEAVKRSTPGPSGKTRVLQNRTQSEPKAGRKLGRAGMSLGV